VGIEELRMMTEGIKFERTEIGGYVTLIPQGRVMYTIAEYEGMQDDRDRWRNLAGVMHQYLVDGNVGGALEAYSEYAD